MIKNSTIKKNAVVITLLSNNNALFILTFEKHREITDEQLIDGVKKYYKTLSCDVEVKLTNSIYNFTDITVKHFPMKNDILKLGWRLISNVPVNHKKKTTK